MREAGIHSAGQPADRHLVVLVAGVDAVVVANPATDLFARIPHGEEQTILREALLLADHNAYHLGQLVMLRRVLGSWPE